MAVAQIVIWSAVRIGVSEMSLEEIHEWVFGELGFCGCGNPEEVLEFVRSVLLAIRKRSHENREIEESRTASLERWTRNSAVIEELIGMDVSPPMAWFFLYTLNDKDLLEHGGNCSGSWLTEKGEEVLDTLNRYPASSIIDCECGDDSEEDEVLDAKVIDG